MAANGGNKEKLVLSTVEIDGYKITMPISTDLKERLASTDIQQRNKATNILVGMARSVISEIPAENPKSNDSDHCTNLVEDQNDDLPDLEALPDLETLPDTEDSNSSKVSNEAPVTATNSQSLFTVEQTRFILQSYSMLKEKFQSPNFKKKGLWSDITSWLNDHFKSSFTSSQVEGRWKTQLTAYRSWNDEQQKSGRERKEFMYQAEFQDIMADRHDVRPISTLQSLPSNREAEDEGVDKTGISELQLLDLPTEVLVIILSYVPILDLIQSVSEVCKLTKELLENGSVFSCISHLDFTSDEMAVIFCKDIFEICNCKVITIQARLVDSEMLFSDLKQLKALKIVGTKEQDCLSECFADNIILCKTLETLEITDVPSFNEADLIVVSSALGNTLMHVHLEGTRPISSIGLKNVLTNLKIVKFLSVPVFGEVSFLESVLECFAGSRNAVLTAHL